MNVLFFLSIDIDRVKNSLLIALLSAAALSPAVFERGPSAEVMLPVENKIIVIDAGHGGFDPGKEGSGGEDEKNINLKIASYLQQYLEQSGANVIMTRTDDSALGTTKKEDMSKRRSLIEDSGADISISVHQNSYSGAGVSGAQVFYYSESPEGERLARCVQDSLKNTLDKSNKRQPKPNDSYYLLKSENMPSIIVECGFLSNPSEEASLNSGEYQQKTAWAIYKGILEYFYGSD